MSTVCQGKAIQVTALLVGTVTCTLAMGLQESTPTLGRPAPGQIIDGDCKTPDQPPVLIHRVEPDYPAAIQKQGVRGVVILYGIIGVDGAISDIRVAKNPSDSLVKLAVHAFQQWRYKPILCHGKPVRMYVYITMTFGVQK
jgi:periplasmic protein TonB